MALLIRNYLDDCYDDFDLNVIVWLNESGRPSNKGAWFSFLKQGVNMILPKRLVILNQL